MGWTAVLSLWRLRRIRYLVYHRIPELVSLKQGKLVSFSQSTETRKKSKQSLTFIDVYFKFELLSLKVTQVKIQSFTLSNVQFVKSVSMRNVKGYPMVILEITKCFFL